MKKLLSMSALVLALCLLLAACSGGSPGATQSGESASPAASDTPAPGVSPVPAVNAGDKPVPEGAIDFADGKTGFLMMDASQGDADPEAYFEVVDHNGGKALRLLAPGNKAPYMAVDVASLLGGRLGDLRRVEMRVTVEGDFYALSGGFHVYGGADYIVDKSPVWSVYLENKNPNIAGFALAEDGLFVNGAKNYFVFFRSVDNAVAAGESARTMLIDYMAFYDADGNVIPADSGAVFDPAPGFNEVDNSFLIPTKDDVALEEAAGECGAWAQAVEWSTLKNEGGTFDPEWLQPGAVLTVYYDSTDGPELVLQSWSDGAIWAKVAPSARNWSNNTAQFTYEDMVEAYGSDNFAETLDKFILGATFESISYSGATLGFADESKEASALQSLPRFKSLGLTGETPGGYGQAVTAGCIKNDGGTFDPEDIKEGQIISVKYQSAVPPELVLQSWSGGAAWAQVAAAYVDETNGIAQFTYEDMAAAYGSEDFAETLDNFIVGDCGEALTVYDVQVSWK